MTRTQVIAIRLTPKAAANRIGETRKLPTGEEQLTVYVTAPPENDKANQAMLRLVAKHFNIALSRLKVVRGQTNRNKWISIK